MKDQHPVVKRTAEFRFYQELNDFLSRKKRKKSFTHEFTGHPSIKDTVEAIGVPHAEIDLLIVEGESVDFTYKMQGGERVAVYPVFEAFDISPIVHLRAKPLRENKFIVDVNLGRLAGYLRLLGFDSYYKNDLDDHEIVIRSLSEQRIILTRDLGILKHGEVTHGYWVRSTKPRAQISEVVKSLQLENNFNPFTRCAECNYIVYPVAKRALLERLPDYIQKNHEDLFECAGCHKIYWKGSHYDRILEWIDTLKASQAALLRQIR